MHDMFMPFRRFFDFSGRSRRREYWLYALFILIVTTILIVVTGDSQSSSSAGSVSYSVQSNSPIVFLWVAITIIPSIAVAIRRCHDQDKSGWFILIPIYSFVLMFFDGTPGPNRFGEDPKGRGSAQTFS